MSKEPAVDAMADCVLPLDIIFSILTRLPVKSLLRFKSVCKPWYKLLATPTFMKMHHDQFSDDPRNQSFIIHTVSHDFQNTMSLFNIEFNEMKPTNLDHPHRQLLLAMDFVGCCNGLLCMSSPPLGREIVLWNPATKMSKILRYWRAGFGFPGKVSIGLGYDPYGGDFKVVRIVCLGQYEGIGVELYSSNSDSWKIIEVDFQFVVVCTKNDVIVNGNPYWVAKVYDNVSGQRQPGKVLVWFDVTKLKFKIVPLSSLDLKKGAQVSFVDWKGSLGAILCKSYKEIAESINVWVFDDGRKIWTKNHTFWRNDMKMDRCQRCSKNGKKIVGESQNQKLFVFDSETGCFKEIVIDELQPMWLWVWEYSEGLAYITGMESVSQIGGQKRG